MEKDWDQAVVTEIGLAMFVAPGTGRTLHRNRPFHGLVLNDAVASKRIHFEDGRVLVTGPGQVHYLPKGTTYRVENVVAGGCWAINFDLLEEWDEAPFSMSVRNHEGVLKLFKDAVDAWKTQSSGCNAFLRKTIYELILELKKEQRRSYLPGKTENLLRPALEVISRDFTSRELSVRELARVSRISEAYFRRIFKEKFLVSPKEYIIALRIEHAKKLLESGQVSVSQAAELCGYFEPCHFSREFLKHTGISPKDYSRAKNPGG